MAECVKLENLILILSGDNRYKIEKLNMNELESAFLTLLEQDTIQPLSTEFFERIEKLKDKASQNKFDIEMNDIQDSK